jgi:ATP-dependent helicase/DNAse subunit B
MEALNNYTQPESGAYLTPTALSAYMECSLRFYFKYIVKIEEKEEIAEDIEGSMFGKLLHHAMHLLYYPYIGKNITEQDIQNILKVCTLKKP